MKNTCTTLAPVKTMSSVDSDAPITAAKAKKVPHTRAADMRSTRNERKKTKPSGARATTHFSGRAVKDAAELGQVDAADPGSGRGRSLWSPPC